MSRLFKGVMLSPFLFIHPEGSTEGEDYLYVVAISNGVIKVGRTVSPQSRISGYIRDARVYGAAVEKVWISRPHPDAKKTEAVLIRWCAAYARSQLNSEYFIGLTFSEVVKRAAQLVAGVPVRPRQPAGRYVVVEPGEGLEVFSLAQVSARTGLTLIELVRGCRDGLFDFSLVNGRIHMTAGQIEQLIDQFLPPIAYLDDGAAPLLSFPPDPRNLPPVVAREEGLAPVPGRLVDETAA